MLKPTSTYKMSKSGKIYLAQTWNRPLANQRRKNLIEAELASRISVRTKREKDN